MIPINLAFFFHSSPAGQVVAVYPSPAGPTESLLHLDAWDEIVAGQPRPAGARAGRRSAARQPRASAHGRRDAEYYLVPIDECYKLVGLIRKSLARAVGRHGGLGGDRGVLRRLESTPTPASGGAPCLI